MNAARNTSASTSARRSIWGYLRDAARTQLWPLPTLGVLVAAALGVGLPRLDARVDDSLSPSVTDYLFGGGAGAARTVLDAVASSLITVTSLTFSLTVVTLQLASSQFSPRLLRTFTRDLVVQATLALFLGTFTYSLTVLRTVRSGGDGRDSFTPSISVTVAFVLAVASVIGLVFFLAHLTQTIRVENMLRNVHSDATATLTRELGDAPISPPTTPRLPDGSPRDVLAEESGFLVRVDEAGLLAAAAAADAVVLLDCCPGSFVVAGTPIAAVWGSSDAAGTMSTTLIRCVTIGPERTAAQDVAFGLRQLTDVGVKALSPGINDPTTAVHALGHSSALLCELAKRQLGPRVLHDDNRTTRVLLARPDLADLLALAVDQPRRYGRTEPALLDRMLMLLRELAFTVGPDQRPAIAEQLRRTREVVDDLSPTERDDLQQRAGLVDEALAGRWPPGSRAW